MCYAIDERSSFLNITNIWVPEIRHHLPNVKILLVGLKSDLRVDGSSKFITFAEGKKLSNDIGAAGFIECSARKRDKISDVFETCVRIAMNKTTSRVRYCNFF